jgi:hypothetical protein
MDNHSRDAPAPDHPSDTAISDLKARSGRSRPATAESTKQQPDPPFSSKEESLVWQNAIQR